MGEPPQPVASPPGLLFRSGDEQPGPPPDPQVDPQITADLDLDQILNALVSLGGDDLRPVFLSPLHDPVAVGYRQDVMRDVERADVQEAIRLFAENLRTVRQTVERGRISGHVLQADRAFLDAAESYINAVHDLAENLDDAHVNSEGMLAMLAFLRDYEASPAFDTFATDTVQVRAAMDTVRYGLHLKGGRVSVGAARDEPDFGIEIEETFERFARDATAKYTITPPDPSTMSRIDVTILELVSGLHEAPFAALSAFHDRWGPDLVHPAIDTFDREIRFFLSYFDLIRPLRNAGSAFCYPTVSLSAQRVSVTGGFELALAGRNAGADQAIVTNDVDVRWPERMLVVTGPNQGGKTTFARMFGQLHYLASLGYPVPAESAELHLPDAIFTHFERGEQIGTSRLEDELTRIRGILEQATPDSIVILNESLASTTVADAVLLGSDLMTRLLDVGALCVWVTFIDEFSTLGDGVVSLVTTVADEDPEIRTYEVVRKTADGRAHAAAIAAKHGLTEAAVRERMSR